MQSNRLYIWAATIALSGFAASACNKEAARNEDPPTQEKTQAAPAVQSAASEKRAALRSYELIRQSLAKDAISATAGDAAALERNARAVARADSSDARAWTSVATSAKELNGMPKDDANAVRETFGEISKHLLDALSDDREITEGLHVFECPMAPGFKKWLQPDEQISNPYMGAKMPECGSKSDL